MSDCLFCKIINGEIETEIVKENDKCVAFADINPQAPVHLLIIPREHMEDVLEAEGKGVMEDLFSMARELAREKEIAERGFRTVINCGREGGQTVSHLHLHLLGGRAMGWPPG